jgi:hypothetical protein
MIYHGGPHKAVIAVLPAALQDTVQRQVNGITGRPGNARTAAILLV